MSGRSQRHLREIYGEDSAGNKPPAPAPPPAPPPPAPAPPAPTP